MPIPFGTPKVNDVPIVGQPLKLHTWFPTLSIVCNCEGQQPLLLVGFGNIVTCPSCARGFRLFAASQDVRTNDGPRFHVDIVLPLGSASADGDKAAH